MNSAYNKQNSSRPLSPHLTIYRPQITSVLSILHRISGVVLFFGLLFLLWSIIFLIYTPESANSWLWKFLNSKAGIGIIIAWSYSLFFHACTGIRHLFWDIGYGFSLKAVTWSGWLALFTSLTLTIISWLAIFLYI
jgi:succinate dehydrogenase / fumarate reductase cytochrome b subunit